MLLLSYVFVAIFGLIFADPTGLENHMLHCNQVDTILDFGKFIGFWNEVAVIVSEKKPHSNATDTCIAAEFVGIIREMSNDVVMKFDGVKTMFLKNVDYNDTSKGCFQRVKDLDDDIIDSRSARYINLMMTQFHIVESPKLFLVQIIWESRRPGSIAMVYQKQPFGTYTQEELKPVIDLVTNLRGPHQPPQFCVNENNDEPAVAETV